MIRQVTLQDEAMFLRAAELYPPAGISAATAWELYKDFPSQAMFWMTADNSVAISAVDGEVSVSVAEGLDIRELCDFIRTVGFNTLNAPPIICESLCSMGRLEAGAVMEYHGEVQYIGYDAAEADIREAYELVCKVSEQITYDPVWSPWYVYLSLLKRRGIGRYVGIHENGILVSTAGIYAQSSERALIAGTVTLPEFRGRGFAGNLVQFLVREISVSGKKAFLLCDDKLCAWYKCLGFEKSGIWNKLYNGERA